MSALRNALFTQGGHTSISSHFASAFTGGVPATRPAPGHSIFGKGESNVSQSFLLPGPNTDFWDWQLHGACRGENSDVFYHPDGERGRARAQRENRAKAICSTCPVIEMCREHALASGEPYGVWGGMSESERVVALRSRRTHATVGA